MYRGENACPGVFEATNSAVVTLYEELYQTKLENELLRESLAAIKEKLAREASERDELKAELRALKHFIDTQLTIDVRYHKQLPLTGILDHLGEIKGYITGSFDITASDGSTDCFKICNSDVSSWESSDTEGSWICIDFKGRKVGLTSYTIVSKSHSYKRDSANNENNPVLHPQMEHWEIQGSNDGSNWTQLDSRDISISSMVGDEIETVGTYTIMSPDLFVSCLQMRHYECERENDKYRFIRIKQTGKNSQGTHKLCLTEVELFGALGL